MNHTRVRYVESLLTHQAAPGTEVLVLSLDPVGGKSGKVRGKKRREGVLEEKNVSNSIGRCLLTG